MGKHGERQKEVVEKVRFRYSFQASHSSKYENIWTFKVLFFMKE